MLWRGGFKRRTGGSVLRLSLGVLVEAAGNVELGYTLSAAAKSLQSCPTLGDPIDGSPPGSPVPGVLKARTLEWAAISFFNV